MKAYFSFFRLSFKKGLKYRAAAWAGIATQFFWGFMYLMIFEAFYLSSNDPMPIRYEEVVQITWLHQAFLVFIMFWIRDNSLFDLVTTGNVAYELLRPLKIYDSWFARLLAGRLSGALLRCFPILILAFLLPSKYALVPPPTWGHLILFLITLFLGLFLVVTIAMLIHISVFYTLSPIGPLILVSTLAEFCSGALIPVPLMPEGLKKVIYVLPFRYTSDLPFRLYAGHIGMKEGLFSILIQILWLSILIFIGQYWMKKALRQTVIQGG